MKGGAPQTDPSIPAAEAASPPLWRRLVRGGEVGLVLLAAVAGVIAGVAAAAMSTAMQLLHEWIFQIAPAARLSAQESITPAMALAGPILGGLLFGVVSWLIFRHRAQPVDPVEANALQGGRMSVADSLIVAAQTVASSGVGASVGLEAGYTQAAGGIASWLGSRFHLRRADLRLMVGCGAGAAIGAAFDAPLAGAFYGFELVLGSYTIAAFAPMMAACFAASLTKAALVGVEAGHAGLPAVTFTAHDLPLLLLLGLLCALAGIAVMRGVTLVEAAFRHSHIPAFLRPAIGGGLVGALALLSPAVFSAGHGAVHRFLVADLPLGTIALILLGKALASSVSIGAGFRGGLFFASLLLGVLFGRLYGGAMESVMPGLVVDPTLLALTGMAGFAVAVVGGPMTMTLLALEMTGQLDLTLAVLGTAGVASLATRRLFGFSFATWRFHLRGESIRGAHDIGWLREMTVERLMQREMPRLDPVTTVAAARRLYPVGSSAFIAAADAQGVYRGMVSIAALYAEGADAERAVGDLLVQSDAVLLPAMTIREALSAFEAAEVEVLAVVDGPLTRRLVGVLTETHAIRRYSDEISRRNRELTGE
ncbi:chloride channel protein [Ancylobacter lacus]|uniref:chloride channel protein n=1 Tax=Ancylobacter lacus TaxID=2579970 RepID=UPI001BCE9355|nr:chloride channel protein [Ancylobacter lacus]MBS7539833.1 chloride channel protein [Ancylobacter lacus]